MTSAFRLTGRHVLAIIVSFFLTIIAANAIFITLAIRSFPGEQEKKSYLQGLAFNEKIAERQTQAALGWKAEIADARLEDGRAEIEIYFETLASSPVTSLEISGLLARPADDGSDHPLSFQQTEPGRYRTVIDGVGPGAWRLSAAATGVRGEKFVLEKRLTFE